MQFNLKTGKLPPKSTTIFHDPKSKFQYLKLYSEDEVFVRKSTRNDKGVQKIITRLFQDLRFMDKHKNIDLKDKMELSTQFKRRVFKPNERFYTHPDQLDALYLIMEGQVGIFYPDQKKLNSFTDR